MTARAPVPLDTDAAPAKVTVIPGDGIGPEAMRTTRLATGARRATLDGIARNGVARKRPIGTPAGQGETSAHVTPRRVFAMCGNIRPVRALPGPRTRFRGRGIDLVVVHRNVEAVDAGLFREAPKGAGITDLLTRIGRQHRWMHRGTLRRYDGADACTKAQGEA